MYIARASYFQESECYVTIDLDFQEVKKYPYIIIEIHSVSRKVEVYGPVFI